MGKVILRIVIFVAILFAAAYFLCNIKPATEYGWLAAIWHGLFLIPNLILHLFDKDILFYSELPTTAYKIFFVVGVVLDSLIGETIKVFSQAVNDVKNQQN
jgi:hypothetical protein